MLPMQSNTSLDSLGKPILSIVICGINEVYKTKIIQNIEETIGVPYELLYHDNRKENQGIAVVYNTLKKNAKGEYICFMHEDLLFHTVDWGKEIINIFQNDSKIGLVGVAGAKYKSRTPSSWSCIDPQFLACNYIQHFKDKSKEPLPVKYNTSVKESEVVMIDGLFMCASQEINRGIQFDEQIVKGFHGYDFNLCLQTIHLNKKIVSTNRILIEHFSDGNVNLDWYYTYKAMCHKCKDSLPLSATKISFLERVSMEYSCFYNGLKALKPWRTQTRWEIIQFVLRYFKIHFLWYFCYKRMYSSKYSISGERTNRHNT